MLIFGDYNTLGTSVQYETHLRILYQYLFQDMNSLSISALTRSLWF